MADEIDRLEIAVEAEANRANRALGGMERRLKTIMQMNKNNLKTIRLSSNLKKSFILTFSC